MRLCPALVALAALLGANTVHAQSSVPNRSRPNPSSTKDRAERILDYHSDIHLKEDGTFLVRETISVNATGSLIKHGIYRDFPTRYKDHSGNNYVVGFHFLSAELEAMPKLLASRTISTVSASTSVTRSTSSPQATTFTPSRTPPTANLVSSPTTTKCIGTSPETAGLLRSTTRPRPSPFQKKLL